MPLLTPRACFKPILTLDKSVDDHEGRLLFDGAGHSRFMQTVRDVEPLVPSGARLSIIFDKV